MPHLTLEYSANVPELDFVALFAELHAILSELGGVRVQNLKSRVVRTDAYYVGEGQPENAFVHLNVALLAGRSPQWKREIGAVCSTN